MLNNIDFDFNKDSKKKKKSNNNNNNYSNDINDQSNSDNFFLSIISKLKIWFNSITFIVKQIVILSVMLWIIDLFSLNKVTYTFANVPYYSIGHFQIWRFITGNFITSGIFSLIFALIFWVSDGKEVEKISGSAKYLIYFFIHSIIIQILYALIYYFLINKNIPEQKDIHSTGLWIYIICEVTINCLISPESNIYLPFIPYPVKSKFFPLIILAVFFIFGGLDMGMFIAVGYGFIYSFFLKKFFELKNEFFVGFENKFMKCFFRFKGYIQVDDTSSTDRKQTFLRKNIDNNLDYSYNNESEGDSDDSDNGNPYNKNLKKFIPFTGKGIKLGGGN